MLSEESCVRSFFPIPSAYVVVSLQIMHVERIGFPHYKSGSRGDEAICKLIKSDLRATKKKVSLRTALAYEGPYNLFISALIGPTPLGHMVFARPDHTFLFVSGEAYLWSGQALGRRGSCSGGGHDCVQPGWSQGEGDKRSGGPGPVPLQSAVTIFDFDSQEQGILRQFGR